MICTDAILLSEMAHDAEPRSEERATLIDALRGHYQSCPTCAAEMTARAAAGQPIATETPQTVKEEPRL